MKNRNLMPTKYQILTYWFHILQNGYNKPWMSIFNDDDYDKTEKTDTCFACGASIGTERCHIIPLSESNDNSIENIHLLCKYCHLESESFNTKEMYFEWFKFKNPTNSGAILMLKNKVALVEKLIKEGKTEILPNYIKNNIKIK